MTTSLTKDKSFEKRLLEFIHKNLYPDYDGYVGYCGYIPKKWIRLYRKRYSKLRKWS